MQVAPVPERAPSDPKIFFVTPNRDRVGSVSLELDRVRTGTLRFLNEADRFREILMVIRGELRDHVGLMSGADQSIADFQIRCHPEFSSECTQNAVPGDLE